MTYRLLCIYETIENSPIPHLRIEVNLDGKSMSLAPFQRKVTLSDLLDDASTNGFQPSALCQLINHAGLNSQPFHIDSRLISHPLVQRILLAHPFSYVKANPKSSLKRISSPSSIIHPSSIVPHLASSVPSGILYIDNPASWHRNIKVRFRYNDALSDFYPSYSPLPYLSNLGVLMQRNEQEETRLLDMLGEDYNPATATLSLNTTDTERLAELTKKGWTLYVSSPNKSASRLYFHHESSGINWFSTDQDCADYLEWVRWGDGFTCSKCGGHDYWQMSDGIRRCKRCRFKNRVTAGTVFEDGRKSLRLWFHVMWLLMAQKTGMSAQNFHDAFGFGSYQTSWGWLQKLRSVMIRSGREKLAGRVGSGST